MQAGVRELHLRVDTGRAGHARVRGRPRRVLEQRGLADAGLAAQHQHRAVPLSELVEQAIESRAFVAAPSQHGSAPPLRRSSHGRPSIKIANRASCRAPVRASRGRRASSRRGAQARRRAMADRFALWVYGVVDGGAPGPPRVMGVDGQPVELLRAGGVAALVSRVPCPRFDTHGLCRLLQQRRTLETLVRAHQDVLREGARARRGRAAGLRDRGQERRGRARAAQARSRAALRGAGAPARNDRVEPEGLLRRAPGRRRHRRAPRALGGHHDRRGAAADAPNGIWRCTPRISSQKPRRRCSPGSCGSSRTSTARTGSRSSSPVPGRPSTSAGHRRAHRRHPTLTGER